MKSSIRTIFKGASITFFGFILERFISFSSRLVAAQYLEVSEFGTIGIGYTFLLFASIICTLGLDKGLARFLPRVKSDTKKSEYVVLAFSTSILLSVILGAVLIYNVDFLADLLGVKESLDILKIFIITIPIAVILRLAIGVSRGESRAKPRLISEQVVLPLSRGTLFIIVAYLGIGSIGFAYGYFLSFFASALLATIFIKDKLFDNGLSILDKKLDTELYKFSFPLIIAGLMSRILIDIDMFLIGHFHSSSLAGVYFVAYPLASLTLLPLSAVGFMVLPVFSKHHSNEKLSELNKQYMYVSELISMLALPLFLLLLLYPEFVISYTFGEKYTSGALALQILSAGFYAHSIFGPNGNTLQAIGRSRTVMVNNSITAGLNILLNIILIPLYGIVGAAIATTFCYSFQNTLYSYHLFKSTGSNPFSFRKIMSTSILMLLAGLLSNLMKFSPLFEAPFILFIIGLLTLITYYISLTDKEKSLIESVF